MSVGKVIVKVKGLANDLEFPDWMSPEQIKKAISNKLRLKNADKHFPETGYTGSTHDIKAFDGSLANPEGDWGRGTYISNSIDDVNYNYAREDGADLTQRIELRAEQLAYEPQSEELLAKYGATKKDYQENTMEIARKIARDEIAGKSKGVVYPLRYNKDDLAVIDGQNSTYLEGRDYYNEAKEEILEEADDLGIDVNNEWELEDAIDERRWELQENDYDGLYPTIEYALRRGGAEDSDIPKIMDHIQDDIADGSVNIGTLDEAIRGNVFDAYTDDGSLASSGEISARVLENLGYKGVIDKTVNKKFGSQVEFGRPMQGMDEDTVHTVIFPSHENKIRSWFAKFDPEQLASKDITKALAPIGVAGLMSEKDASAADQMGLIPQSPLLNQPMKASAEPRTFTEYTDDMIRDMLLDSGVISNPETAQDNAETINMLLGATGILGAMQLGSDVGTFANWIKEYIERQTSGYDLELQ